jgi:hypothetical protein
VFCEVRVGCGLTLAAFSHTEIIELDRVALFPSTPTGEIFAVEDRYESRWRLRRWFRLHWSWSEKDDGEICGNNLYDN